jgi:sulfonate transport system permease protein
MTGRVSIILMRITLVVALLAAWELATGGWLGPKGDLQVYFSSPIKIIGALFSNRAVLLSDSMITLTAAFLGLFAGTTSGLLLGVVFARFSVLDQVVEPILQAINAIPRPALAPLLIIWFGLGITSKVVLSWSIVFFIIFYNVYSGVKSIDPDYIKCVRVMGATSGQIVRMIVVPSVMSWVFAAFRVCVAYSLLGAVVGEFAGASAGLGYRLIMAEGLLRTDLLYAVIFILMIVGYTLTTLARVAERRLLRWRPPVMSI